MNNLTQILYKLNKEIKVLTNAISEIESACDDHSFFISDGDDEYAQCVIDVNTIRQILEISEDLIQTSTPDNSTKGKWIWVGNKYICSECGHYPWRINTEEHDEAFVDLKRENAYKFCPHCGIKMQQSWNMTLDEAIKKYEGIAEEKEKLASTYESLKDYGNPKSSITSGHDKCLECASEYRQIVGWLNELKNARDTLHAMYGKIGYP